MDAREVIKVKKGYMYTIRLLPAALALTAPGIAVSAADGTGTVGIGAYYSTGITAEEGDLFTITYEEKTSGETGVIEVDASEVRSVMNDYEVAPGDYDVTNIEYNGQNESIIEEGYGTENGFGIKEAGDDDILHIYIGREELATLEADYSQAMIKDSEHDENGNRTVFEDETGKYRYVQDESGNTVVEYLDDDSQAENASAPDGGDSDASDGEASENEAAGTVQENAQEPITEYYEREDEEDDDGSIFLTLGLCAGFGLVCLAVLIVLHKKGKI